MSSLRRRGSLLDPNFARRLGELRWARRVENDKDTLSCPVTNTILKCDTYNLRACLWQARLLGKQDTRK